MATSAELLQIETRLDAIIAEHGDGAHRIDTDILKGVGVTQNVAINYFSAPEVSDLIVKKYITRWSAGVRAGNPNQITTFGSSAENPS